MIRIESLVDVNILLHRNIETANNFSLLVPISNYFVDNFNTYNKSPCQSCLVQTLGKD